MQLRTSACSLGVIVRFRSAMDSCGSLQRRHVLTVYDIVGKVRVPDTLLHSLGSACSDLFPSYCGKQ
jgi:hypothetical protein